MGPGRIPRRPVFSQRGSNSNQSSYADQKPVGNRVFDCTFWRQLFLMDFDSTVLAFLIVDTF